MKIRRVNLKCYAKIRLDIISENRTVQGAAPIFFVDNSVLVQNITSQNIDKAGALVVKLRKKGLIQLADENKSEKKLSDTHPNEARFDVKSLDEVKDENGNGVFHLRTKTKWIIAVSILILICAGGLTYAAMEYLLAAENWQLSIWILCTIIALYSIMARSLASMLFNVVLFFGVSLIPVWQLVYVTFRPAVEKLFSGS